MKNENIVTIQKTSKKLKLMLVLCRLAYVVAVIWGMCEFAKPSGIPNPIGAICLFTGAAIVALVTRFLIWWNHC